MMTVETYLANSIEERYGEELAAKVNRGFQEWEEQKKPEESGRFDEILRDYVYPYIAAADVLLEEGVDKEEVKQFLTGLVEEGPTIPQSTCIE